MNLDLNVAAESPKKSFARERNSKCKCPERNKVSSRNSKKSSVSTHEPGGDGQQ